MNPSASQNQASPAKERRRLQRFDLRLPASIEMLPHVPHRAPVVLNLTTRDISARGAFFPSVRSFEEGTRVKVDLILTPEKPRTAKVKRALIKVMGTVLRKEPEGMAVHFDNRYTLAPLNYA